MIFIVISITTKLKTKASHSSPSWAPAASLQKYQKQHKNQHGSLQQRRHPSEVVLLGEISLPQFFASCFTTI
jgi:hypothetical protein